MAGSCTCPVTAEGPCPHATRTIARQVELAGNHPLQMAERLAPGDHKFILANDSAASASGANGVSIHGGSGIPEWSSVQRAARCRARKSRSMLFVVSSMARS
jgi:hypothetical protein